LIKLTIGTQHFIPDKKITQYAIKKIGSLDKYLPKTAKSAHGNVILVEDDSRGEGNIFVCEAIIHVPESSPIQAKEATLNMYAAIDIVEAKLKTQIIKYKDKHNPKWRRSKILLNKLFLR